MVMECPDGVVRRPQTFWFRKLVLTRAQYMAVPNAETKREYLRVLKAFTDLVLQSKLPSG